MTFAMLLTVRASAFLVTGGRSVGALPKNLLVAGRLNVAELPLVFVIGLVVAAVGGLILSYTKFWPGDLSDRARTPAPRPFPASTLKRLMFFVYLDLGHVGAAFAAFVFMMRSFGAATPNAGDPLLLQIVGSVVLLGGKCDDRGARAACFDR